MDTTTCWCGGDLVRYSHTQPSLLPGYEAVVKVVTLCGRCLDVRVVDTAAVAASTLPVHA